MRNILRAALLYIASGLSVLPIRLDGSKAPALDEWSSLNERQPTESEVRSWFRSSYGIAMICGAVSGNVEVIDFDDYKTFLLWLELLEHKPGIFEKLIVVETPRGGRHIVYKCKSIEGSKKLALRLVEVSEGTKGAKLRDGKWTKIKTLVETKGEGGYVIVAPSPASTHPSNKPYIVLEGDYCSIPEIDFETRALLLGLAASLNEYREPEYKAVTPLVRNPSVLLPGDDFNGRGDWHSLLTRHGWRFLRERGGVSYWQKPDDRHGHHATTNFRGSNLLYVFSTSTEFEPRRGYTLFSAYALLEHGGDFDAAAQALSTEGYGQRKKAIAPPEMKLPHKPEVTIRLDEPIRPKDTRRLPDLIRPTSTVRIEEVSA